MRGMSGVLALVTIAGLSIGSRESVLAIALSVSLPRLAASFMDQRAAFATGHPAARLSQAYLRNVIKPTVDTTSALAHTSRSRKPLY